MEHYLYQVEYKDLETHQHYVLYHLGPDPAEIERETYREDDAIPKSIQYIGAFQLPKLSKRQYGQLLIDINRTDRPESVLKNQSLKGGTT